MKTEGYKLSTTQVFSVLGGKIRLSGNEKPPDQRVQGLRQANLWCSTRLVRVLSRRVQDGPKDAIATLTRWVTLHSGQFASATAARAIHGNTPASERIRMARTP